MENLDCLRWAKFYASVKHGEQKYGGLPYTHHLAAVETVLRSVRKISKRPKHAGLPARTGGAEVDDGRRDTGTMQ